MISFRMIAGIYMQMTSIIGMLINGKVIYMLRKPSSKTAFFYFCRARSVSNCCALVAVAFWSGPVTLLNDYFLPYVGNAWFGQFSGQLAYPMGMLFAFCMTVNRLLAVFFPLRFRIYRGNVITTCSIIVCFIPAFGFFIWGLIEEHCAYIYDLPTLSWIPESECAIELSKIMLYMILSLSSIATIINIITFLKLKTLSADALSASRNKKNLRMLIQSTLQDILYVIDMLSGMYALYLSEAIWYQFIVNSAFWQTHIMLDGLVMYFCNRSKGTVTPTASFKRINNSSIAPA